MRADEASHLPRADAVDVLLLLEGTYPYVSGGVSSWVYEIIRGFPGIRFGAIFIGSKPEDYGAMKYPLPANLVHLEVHYLFGDAVPARPQPLQGDPRTMELMREMHARLRDNELPKHAAELLGRVAQECRHGGHLDHHVFLHSQASWDFIAESYNKYCSDPSFVDYFWTVRVIHSPIWVLLGIARNSVKARAYHAVSTGYAGFLGAVLKIMHPAPLLLSEHGIYTKERRIDIYQAQWIKDNRSRFERDSNEISYFRRMWVNFFEVLGRLTYHMSDDIVALYEANRQRQIADGAPPERTSIIPNGIDIARYAPLRAQRPERTPPVFCLIGRVVPIKDIQTFIRAAHVVIARMPQAEAWIAGPADEDPDYAHECRALAESLGLKDKLRFLGFQKLVELLPDIGVVVLSSISEALPLVILEGYAAGVPAVATDVGSCRQLIYGLDELDRALGASGRVVRIADPQGLADAVLELLSDEKIWHAASTAGIRRVERYYGQKLMFDRYRNLFDKALTWPE